MASVRQSRGRLFLDFRVNSERKRAFIGLPDTPANRAELEKVARQLQGVIDRGGCPYSHLRQLGLIGEEQREEGADQLECAKPEVVSIGRVIKEVPTSNVQPMRQFAEQWFTEFKVGWRRTYQETVRGTLDRYLLPKFGATPVDKISRAQILEFRAYLSTVRGRSEGSTLSPARINTIMLILRQILTEASDRFEFTMPMGRLRPLKIPRSDVNPFTLDEVHRLIQTIRPDYRDYMTVRFFTGMRSGELHGLKWKYVDFERRLILVRETMVRGEEEYTKTDSSQRDIQMSQLVYDALMRQHSLSKSMSEFVFCNRHGEALDTNNVAKRIWYPLLRYLDLEQRRPYQTRHTAATLWLAAGEAPEWIARQLGHASTEMLFRVYSRYVPNLTRRDGSAFDRLVQRVFVEPTPDGVDQPAQPPPHYGGLTCTVMPRPVVPRQAQLPKHH